MSIKVEYLGTYPIKSRCRKHGSSDFILIEDENGKRICHKSLDPDPTKRGSNCETGIFITPENEHRIRKLLRNWADNN